MNAEVIGKLYVLDNKGLPNLSKCAPVTRQGLLIGSAPGSNIRLNGSDALPQHVRIIVDTSSRVFITYLGPATSSITINGNIIVNDRRPVRLYHTNSFQILNAGFYYEDEEPMQVEGEEEEEAVSVPEVKPKPKPRKRKTTEPVSDDNRPTKKPRVSDDEDIEKDRLAKALVSMAGYGDRYIDFYRNLLPTTSKRTRKPVKH